jgi:phosphatidylserine/phosphatidylglycerophosphate/cardiolipin synthase-like enzyme
VGFLIKAWLAQGPGGLPRPGGDTANLPAPTGTGLVQVYFTDPRNKAARDDPRNPARALAGYIDQVKKTLDVAGYEINNTVITDALLRAVHRGVRVRVVTDTDNMQDSGPVQLRAAGVPVQDDLGRKSIMHNKFMVLDGRAVWTGSMNFTENCAYKNNNHGVYVANDQLAENYATKFKWLFEERKFGAAPRGQKIPNPVITLADGTVVENYFSTHDHVANHVIQHLQTAKRSIHFLAFSFTHKDMATAMLDRAAAGAELKGVFDKGEARPPYSTFDRLRTAGRGVEVYTDANAAKMHHKVIVIDGEVTVAGSFNFSDNADKDNDENVLVIFNSGVARQFEGEFQRLFTDARGGGGVAAR